MDNQLYLKQLEQLLIKARQNGLGGLAGLCGQASIAINHVLFDNKAQYLGFFNKALFDSDYYMGHIVLRATIGNKTTVLVDIDGVLSEEEAKAWGMLDSTDSDYVEMFNEFDIECSDTNFDEVICIPLTEEFILSNFNCSDLQSQKSILLNTKNYFY